MTGISPGTIANVRGTVTLEEEAFTFLRKTRVTEIANGTYFLQNRESEKYADITNQTITGSNSCKKDR